MARQTSREKWSHYIRAGGKFASSQKLIGNALSSSITFKGRILGIDPSLRGTGIAVIHVIDPQNIVLESSLLLHFNRSMSFHDCLGDISQAMEDIASRHPPDHVAVEETIYVQNIQTAHKLGAARGSALGPFARRKIPIYEYAPLRIKQAVAGRGRASKDQVASMVGHLTGNTQKLSDDETDAAATAICHAFTWRGDIAGQ